MIVDFAVVDDDIAAAVRVHRLVAGRRNVDDREPVVGEADARFDVQPDSAVIRPPVPDAPCHCGERPRLLSLRRPFSADETRNATHGLGASLSLLIEKVRSSGLDC